MATTTTPPNPAPTGGPSPSTPPPSGPPPKQRRRRKPRPATGSRPKRPPASSPKAPPKAPARRRRRTTPVGKARRQLVTQTERRITSGAYLIGLGLMVALSYNLIENAAAVGKVIGWAGDAVLWVSDPTRSIPYRKN